MHVMDLKIDELIKVGKIDDVVFYAEKLRETLKKAKDKHLSGNHGSNSRQTSSTMTGLLRVLIIEGHLNCYQDLIIALLNAGDNLHKFIVFGIIF